ncbi:GNAT family N-acetyltransferase [Pararhizobium sp. IMCC21322]|uniref:GNAT family N-acetyltransferase n=1 Tax=Pararhizobium sp. IMCC21322 TaxID=3067903 RepID=UPI002741855D|nr:GNAT family N-acetyltransferase [Pararhizobium sp. IMCC21322]
MEAHNSRIRKATLADAEAVATCIDAAYARYSDRITDLPPVSDGCADEIKQDRVWVAIQDNEIAGALFLVPQDGFMKLANLAVHPEHGGKGLGTELIAFAEQEAIRRGYTEMRLNTHTLMPENVTLYKKLGWVEFSRNGNTVSLKKRLPAG